MYTAFPTEPVFPPAAAEGSQNKHARKVVEVKVSGQPTYNTISTIIQPKNMLSIQHHR